MNKILVVSPVKHFFPFRYSPSEEPINWREVEDKGMYQIHCASTDSQESYYLNVSRHVFLILFFFQISLKPIKKKMAIAYNCHHAYLTFESLNILIELTFINYLC